MGHIELAAPVTHIWYFKGVRAGWATCSTSPRRTSEKVIYFAAYMITGRRGRPATATCLHAGATSRSRSKELADPPRRRRRRPLAKKSRGGPRPARGRGAKADVKRKVRAAPPSAMSPSCATAPTSRSTGSTRCGTGSKNLRSRTSRATRSLPRDARPRSAYFPRAPWARPSSVGSDLRHAAEAESLREIIATGKGQRKTRALKRLASWRRFLNRPPPRWAWCSTPSR